MVEVLRVKQQEINRKLVSMQAGWDLQKAEIQAKMHQKDTELLALSNKLQAQTSKANLCESLLASSGEKYLKSLQDLNYQQMHLLGLSLKNSKISRLFVRTSEGLKPNHQEDLEYDDLKFRLIRKGLREQPQDANKINQEEFREAFKQMQESVALNSAKHMMTRAYTLGAPYMKGMPTLGDEDHIEALKCIGQYSIQELHRIIQKHENQGHVYVDRSVQQMLSDGQNEQPQLDQMPSAEERALRGTRFFEEDHNQDDTLDQGMGGHKTKMSLRSLLEDSRKTPQQGDRNQKSIGATGAQATKYLLYENQQRPQSSALDRSQLDYSFLVLSELRDDEEEQIRKMVQRIEDHPYRDRIVDYICALYKNKTEDRGTQTEEVKEKARSSTVLKTISLDKRSTISQAPRFARNYFIPRVHPCNKFIVSLAEKIRNNPKILRDFVPSLSKTIKRVCQIFVERHLNKESRQGLLEYIYDMTFNTYGLASMAEKKLTELLIEIFIQTKKHAVVEIFARFSSISSYYYSLDDMDCFYKLIELADQESPAKRTSSISQKAQELVKFLPREVQCEACLRVIHQIIDERIFPQEKSELQRKITAISSLTVIHGAPKEKQKSATAPIDIYVFVGLFINVYQVIKLKIRKRLESNQVIENCSESDPEKFFFNKSEFLEILRKAQELRLISYYDESSLLSFYQRVAIIPPQNLRSREGEGRRSNNVSNTPTSRDTLQIPAGREGYMVLGAIARKFQKQFQFIVYEKEVKSNGESKSPEKK